MSPYIYPVIKTTEIETTFSELAEQWRRETGMLSVASKISMHPAHQGLTGEMYGSVQQILKRQTY